MKQIVVNDASCLIDLRKGGLLSVLCRLPYRMIVPLPIRDSELLDFSAQHWRVLDSGGMVTYDLTADEVTAAFTAKTRNPALSANDCFCLVTAQINEAVLLTGDARLAKTAKKSGVRVHGVL
ncbi:MAG: type II toxin-antitoxin system VapC family toxin, partial [Gammaproteobacteria bacterium]|nr:type II toxin-antitoxin system VapC family toxin [Gammaproteobacteria bacterium]